MEKDHTKERNALIRRAYPADLVSALPPTQSHVRENGYELISPKTHSVASKEAGESNGKLGECKCHDPRAFPVTKDESDRFTCKMQTGARACCGDYAATEKPGRTKHRTSLLFET